MGTSKTSSVDPFQHDPDFLEQFRAGRASALEKVYRSYHKPLRSFVSRGFAFQSEGRPMYFSGMAQGPDVEDILQETFRRAFGDRARATYDGIRPYKNYLFTIARNAVITDVTARSRQIPVGEVLMRDPSLGEMSALQSWVVSQRCPTMDPDETPECETQMEGLEVYSLVEGFVEALEEVEQQRFFRVRFLGMHSQESTARIMGWNRARVRKLESRLRKAFLAHLSGSGYLEMRAEARRVRRAPNPEQHRNSIARARDLWRSGDVQGPNELIFEAA